MTGVYREEYRVLSIRGVTLCCVLLGAAVPGVTSASAQTTAVGTGRVVGTIIDQANGFTIPGARIEGPGGVVAISDLDGKFALDVPPGPQTIQFVMDGYATQSVTVTVASGRAIALDVALPMARFSENVTVRGTSPDQDSSSAEAALATRRAANVISDNVGAQELKAGADSNAAAGLQRVTGLSVVGDGFTFVRGLGERYSNTTLAGATIPSTQPERKVVGLDLFPSGLLDSVSVVKSYTPDRPADFAGGLIEIVPLKIASRAMFDLSYAAGGNSRTLGNSVLDYPGSGTDWLAFDDGRRSLPGGFPSAGERVVRGGIYTPEVGVLASELETLGESFENVWSPRERDGRVNQNWSLSGGNRWGRFGLIGSLTQAHRNSYQDEVQNYFRVEEGGLTPFSEYEYRAGRTVATLAGTASAGYQFTPNNRLAYQFFSTNTGEREARVFEGFNADVGANLRNSRVMWVEENLNTSQVTGDHLFQSLSMSRLDWRGAYSRSNRDEPDLREVLYDDLTGVFRLADESQSGFRMFNDLSEDALDLGVSWSSMFTNWTGGPAVVKFGPGYVRRERDFSSRRFRMIPLSTTGLDLTQSPEALFTPANIGTRFELREETRPTDTYDADQTITSAFGMIDLPLATEWRLIGGLRVEHFEQNVNTFDPFSLSLFGDAQTVSSVIEETDLFPSVNLVYAVRPDQNLRFGVSQTVNRPEFREVSPFEFTDIVGGRAVVGNPELTRSLIRNVDVRWEWFPGAREVLAASFFLKDFSEPIERFIEPTAQLRTSFTNADSARNTGFELEARKSLSPHVLIGANYTYVDSEITLTPFQTNVLTTLSRPLAGTSENILNLMGELRWGNTIGRVMFNYFDDRIADVGALGLPDIYEASRGTLDLAVSHRIRGVNLRFSIDNLTDERVEFTQGLELQRAYRYGRTTTFELGYSLF
jgi:outer membrane receptor protein involved in Fe transport